MKLTNLFFCCTTARTQPYSDDTTATVPKTNGEASSAAQPVVAQPNHSAPATKPKPAKAASVKAPELEPYAPSRAAVLFNTYADADDSSVIGAEGFERLCEDAELPLEGVEPLLLAWQLGTSEMARITRAEWDKGTAELQISSLPVLTLVLRDLESLLFPGKPPPKSSAAAPRRKPGTDPYNRARYFKYVTDPTKGFNELYMFCFNLAKPPGARNIDMQIALAFWSVLVLPRYPLMQDILNFINEKGTYKGVNKDLWLMVLEFCRSISPTLQDYEADGAWPTMLDDFVTWKKSKAAGNGSTNHD